MKIDFSAWNLAAVLEESTFAFDPPKDAEKINMAAIEDVTATQKKGGKK